MPTAPPKHRPAWQPPPAVARLQRNREHDTKRDQAQPWRVWYRTARWQRIRAAQLKQAPLCEMCLASNRVTPATVCDHVVPHKGDPDLFWWGPFQSLCKRCHDRDKQRLERAHDRDEP